MKSARSQEGNERLKTGKGGCCSTISNLSRSKLRIGLLRHTLSAVGSVLVGGGGGYIVFCSLFPILDLSESFTCCPKVLKALGEIQVRWGSGVMVRTQLSPQGCPLPIRIDPGRLNAYLATNVTRGDQVQQSQALSFPVKCGTWVRFEP